MRHPLTSYVSSFLLMPDIFKFPWFFDTPEPSYFKQGIFDSILKQCNFNFKGEFNELLTVRVLVLNISCIAASSSFVHPYLCRYA